MDRPDTYNREGKTITREEYDEIIKEKEKKDAESD